MADLRRLLGEPTVDMDAICRFLQELVWTHPGCAHWPRVASMTDTEILTKWERNRRTAAAEGTRMHVQCECLA